MALASTSRVNLRYIQESVFGVVPVTGNPYELRFTGESLNYEIQKEVSQEINSTRTDSSITPVKAMANGGVQGDLQYAEYDRLIASTLQAAPLVYGTSGVGAAVSLDFTATTITAAVAPVGVDAFTTLALGQWFRVGGTTSNLNFGKVLRVSKTVAPTSTVITLDTNTPALVQTGAAGSTIQTSRFTNGTLQTSFSIERESDDVGQYIVYTGQTPSKMAVGISSGALSTVSFDFMGSQAYRDVATHLPGTPVPSFTYDVHSSVSGPSCHLWEGGAPLTSTFVKSISFDYDNALRNQDAICSLATVAIGSGTIALTGSLEVYFANGDQFDKFVANEYTEIIFSSLDTDGNGYIFTLPKANLTSFTVQAGGRDQDLMATINFTAFRDADAGSVGLRKVVFIDRVGAAVPL